MWPTFRRLLLAIFTASAVSSASVPHGAKPKPPTSTSHGPLPAFKDSGTYYHHEAAQVPYYTGRPEGLNGIKRQYWFAVEELEYDYAPLGFDFFNGGYLNETVAAQWTVQSESRIGSVYMKACFREYTDGTYTNRISHPSYMGFLGPIIRAEVGDTIQVTLRNMASYNYSFHVHGAFYNAASDGINFNGAIGGKSVAPNQQYAYVFDIPLRSGPGDNDTSSIVWPYYSDVLPTDIYSGLLGPMIIYKKGILNQFGVPDPNKINTEVVTILNIADENQSNYFKQNVAKYLGSNFVVDPTDTDFYESNKMHHINGFVYANLDSISLQANSSVRWYVVGLGNEVDIHTAHWHGSTVIDEGHRSDVVALLPATFKVVDLTADNPGQWLFHCHVTYHMMAGMVVYYQVNAASSEHGGWQKRFVENDPPFLPARLQ